MNSRGFTLLEIGIVAMLLVVVTGAAMGMALTGQQVAASNGHEMKASTRVYGLAERMITEIRDASVVAEDIDEDDDPDDIDEEDRNGNGRVDDDWSLADGETATELSFNRTLSGGLVTDRITFRLDGGIVWRDSGSTAPESAVLAQDVTAMTFTRKGDRITLNLVVSSGVGGRGGKQVALRRAVMLRN